MLDSIKRALLGTAAIILLSGSTVSGCPVGDLDRNCKIDLGDVLVLANHWLDDSACTEPNCANINEAGRVDTADFAHELGPHGRIEALTPKSSGAAVQEFASREVGPPGLARIGQAEQVRQEALRVLRDCGLGVRPVPLSRNTRCLNRHRDAKGHQEHQKESGHTNHAAVSAQKLA